MPLNIFLTTSDEHFYLPTMIYDIVSNCNHNIEGIVLLSPVARNLSWVETAKQFYDLYGFFHFARTSIVFSLLRVLDRLPILCKKKRSFSIKCIAEEFHIPVYTPENINSKEFLCILEEKKPDLIVSLSASQIFRRPLINLPKYGIINVHGAPLPKYRGLMPSFWMLLHEEKQGAVTVHFMEEKLDSGDIIAQRFFDIGLNETQHSFIVKSKKIGAELVLEVLDLFEAKDGHVPRIDNPDSEGTYFGFPSKGDAIRFRKMGKKFK